MATESDLEIVVHSKDQLEILSIKMDSCKDITFNFWDIERIKNECGYKILNSVSDNADYFVSISDYDSGYILRILDMKDNRKLILDFLNKIKIPDKDIRSTIIEVQDGNSTNIYIKNLDAEMLLKVKKALSLFGIIDQNKRPFYEQDPRY